ncbi:MAG TPA: vitamin K epoxide reductase family protein [Terriglobia bacterium]|nr:vitamin K epoxide reductase family protein [Terriglobia bacterium]
MKARVAIIAVIAFIGMIDALYLSLKRNAGPIPCHITKGCNDVLTSKYSALAGVPISWFGLAFYFAVFSLAVFVSFEAGKPEGRPLRWIYTISGLALVISGLLVGVQAFILKAFCEYCLLSAVLVLTIFLLAPQPFRRTHPE